jgi:hypothetical protein
MNIELKIDENIKNEAYKHSLKRIEFEYDRFKLPIEQRISMILLGTIGQLIFKKYLDVNNIKYNFEYQAGKFDEIDFEVGGDIYEIKTSGFIGDFSRLNLLYSEGQFQRGMKKNYAYCVQIFIDGYNRFDKLLDLDISRNAVISGYIEFPKIAKYKQQRRFYGDDYKIPLGHLKDVNELFNIR